MKTLEETKKEKVWWENHAKEKQIEYDIAKKLFKQAEADVKTFKKSKNKKERELKFAKKEVEKLHNRVRDYPTKVRKWGKEHTGELINSLGNQKL